MTEMSMSSLRILKYVGKTDKKNPWIEFFKLQVLFK